MNDITLSLPVLIGLIAYTVLITAYVVKISVTQTAQVKDHDRLEKAFNDHVTARAGTTDRLWSAIEAGANRITKLEAKAEI